MAQATPAAARPHTVLVLVPLLAGCAVALALAAYARVHDPTGQATSTLGFSSMIGMKVWLATVAAAFGVFQLGSALRLFEVVGSGPAPRWVTLAHRTSGVLAVLVSAPVAFHCLWALGFSTFDGRTLTHSLLGCAFYGAFVAKMLSLKIRGLPSMTVPLLGGLTFATLAGLWLTSSLWYFRTVGVPPL